MNNPLNVKVTPEGLEKLKQELKDLGERRPQVLTRMVAAREQGDLSENAGYHAAKDELGRIDRRTRELKLMIRFADVIGGGDSLYVSLGSTVVVAASDGQQEFKIVGPLEASPREGRISDESPLGYSLLGKCAGDSVEVMTGDGKITYKLLEVRKSS